MAAMNPTAKISTEQNILNKKFEVLIFPIFTRVNTTLYILLFLNILLKIQNTTANIPYNNSEENTLRYQFDDIANYFACLEGRKLTLENMLKCVPMISIEV